MTGNTFNILYDVYNDLLKDCVCHNYFNRPYVLAQSAKRWILDKSIDLCINSSKEPVDILDNLYDDLYLDKLFYIKKPESKIVYQYALEMIKEIKYEIIRRMK